MKAQTSSRIMLLVSMIIFGTIGIFTKYINASPAMISMFRGAIGTLFLLLASWVTGSRLSFKAIGKNIFLLSLSGVFIGLNWMLLFEAYNYASVSVVTICYYFAPVFVIILAALFLKERLSLVKIICIIFSLIGVLFVTDIINGNSLPVFASKGVIYGLSAALLYSFVVIINKFIKNVSAYERTVTQLFFATVTAIVFIYYNSEFVLNHLDTTSIILLIVLGIFHTGIAYTMYFGAMKNLRGQTIAFCSYIDPVVAILLSSFVLREPLDAFTIIGAVLIFGSALINEAKG